MRRSAAQLDAESDLITNNFAWYLLTCPDERLRDYAAALPLAKKAVELDANNAHHRNTLGLAYYRLGDWSTARHELEQAVKLRAEPHAVDYFILAMTCWQLGEHQRACEYYDRAVQCMPSAPKDEEFGSVRRDAEALFATSTERVPE